MKHPANRSRSTVKSKAKTITQNKAVTKTKPVTKKSVGKTVAAKSVRKSSVQKAKLAGVKLPAKDSGRAAKPKFKTAVPKVSAKTLNASKTVVGRKAKPAARQIEKPKTKKVALKTSVKAIKTPLKKTTIASANKITEAVKKKLKKPAAMAKAKPKTAPVKLKTSVKALVKTAKPQPSKVTVRVKPRQSKVKVVAASKIKSAAKNPKLTTTVKKPGNIKNAKPIIKAKVVQRKKIVPAIPAKKAGQKTKKIQPVVAAKKVVRKTDKIKLAAPIKKTGRTTQRLKPAIGAPVKNRKPEIKKAAAVEKTIEAIQPQKPKNKKARPISSAVFRGKKERYDFKVFELNEKFEPIPAVYIISKRKTDRNKRGHHALICIGETVSISDELKRHRKGKCVKKHAANVVSILPEVDEKTRLRIESDLKAAHTVVCNLD